MRLPELVRQAKRVYVIGNGGSYANALHIVNDLLTCGIKAYTIDPATMARIANDHGWSHVFSYWLRVVGEVGDLLIALSGSGTSSNILMAVDLAKTRGMLVWEEYGAVQGLDMEAAEERQVWLGHRLKKELVSGPVMVADEAAAIAERRTVLANGCFDVLHVGHILHLEEARSLGGRLVVSLTLDSHVNKGPGLPINPWDHRAAMLRALRCVDDVVPTTSCYAAIRAVRPQVFVKGNDYEDSPLLHEALLACAEVGALLHITKSPKLSSGEIIRRMKATAL
jgi:rfaE bifunctional protein nucleotidyltransferase chain/domain